MEKIWLKSYPKDVPPTITFREITLSEGLSQTASRYPDNPALVFQGTTVTFHELDRMANMFAATLIRLGIRPGDRVSFLMPNLVQTVVGIYGALRAGAVVTMHNPRNEDVAHRQQFSEAQPEAVVCLDLLVPRMINLRKRVRVPRIISCHIRDYLPFWKKTIFPMVYKDRHLSTPEEDDVYEFSELMSEAHADIQPHKPALEDTAFLLFTSGTTGVSKGVELTHRNVSVNPQQVRAWFPNFTDGKERVVGCLPFFHVFGLTCALNVSIMYGFAVILVPLPDAKQLLEAIDKHKPTFIAALPGNYNAMLNDPSLRKYDLTSLSACFSGGAALPLELIREFERLTGARLCEGYGLTESSPATHINPLGGKTKGGTIGLPLPSTDARIVDLDNPDQVITTPGTYGELCISGPQVMKGYRNLPGDTRASLRTGWLHTGDVATFDSEGYFTIIDRRKDVITARGNRIFPRDVEEALFAHPKIVDACVIGYVDPVARESLKAYVVVRKGEEAGPGDFLEYCRKHLPMHQWPKEIEILDELPRSPVGKTDRKELKRMHLVAMSAARSKGSGEDRA